MKSQGFAIGVCCVLVFANAVADMQTCTFLGSGANRKGNYNVSVGISSGTSATSRDPISNVSVGYSANFHGDGESRIAIGSFAGTSGSGDSVVAIGQRTGEASNGDRLVLIGDYEYTNQMRTVGVTSINGKQIYINKTADEFAISVDQDYDSVTNAPLYYKNGVIHINAGLMVDDKASMEGDMLNLASPDGIQKYVNAKSSYSDEYVRSANNEFDVYMAPYGNDQNGGSMSFPKATFEGCIEALGAEGGKVGVLPGSYAPVALKEDSFGFLLYSPTGNCHFVAIGGKSRTSIIGIYENEDGYNDGFSHSMAFASGNTTFEGFTISKIGCYRKSPYSEGYNGTTPAFSCLTLKDCLVTQCNMPVGFCFGVFNTCYLKDTVITKMSLFPYSTTPDTELFPNCAIVDSVFSDFTIASTNTFKFFGVDTEAYYSAFDLPKQLDMEVNSGKNTKFQYCTFIWGDDSVTGYRRVSPANANNCYFCVGNGTLSGGASNVFASVSQTYLSDEYIPYSINCPAIRTDGSPDAGWRDSGLSELKSLSLRPYLKIENGSLGVYSNGVKIAEISTL